MSSGRLMGKRNTQGGEVPPPFCGGEIHPQGKGGLVNLETPFKSSGVGGEINNSMYVLDGSTRSRCYDDF